MSKLLLSLGLAIGAGVAVWRGKPVIANAEFFGPIRAALGGDGAYLYNVNVDNSGPAILIGHATGAQINESGFRS